MGLLQKLLSTLGLRESTSGRGSERAGETTVTVEHEPDTASESAVKGTDGATASTGTETAEPANGTTEEDVGASDPTETAGSIGSTDEADAAADIEEAEPQETEPEDTEPEEAEPAETETEDEEAETEPADDSETDESAAGSDESTDVLNGIGPAYAERLENAGVQTVAELAAADAADLADETGLGEGRISNWIEQAKEY